MKGFVRGDGVAMARVRWLWGLVVGGRALNIESTGVGPWWYVVGGGWWGARVGLGSQSEV